MSNNGLVNFASESNKLPVGGDFTPSGMIGCFSSSVLFAFYSTTDVAIVNVEPPKGLIIRKMGKGFRYYLKDSAQLDTLRETLGEPYKPQQSWVLTTPRATVCNVEADNLSKFSESISMELNITTLGSRKNRHTLHMIALPGLVHAVAKAMGYDVPDLSFNDLMGNQVVFDNAFQVKMIGDEKSFELSQLWLQRAALWKALGEEDASKYQPKGTGTKSDTSSDKLSNCLNYLTHDWKSMWCRVVQVPDPRVDAVYGDESKRLTIPAVYEIFANEKAAKEAGAKELAERQARQGATSPANGHGASALVDATVPEAWQSDPESWHSQIAAWKKFYAGKPDAVILKAVTNMVADAEKQGTVIGATVDQIIAAMKAA